MSSRWGWFKDPSFPNHLFQRCHGPSIVFGVDGNFPKLKLKLENLSKNIKNISSNLRKILNKWHLRKVTVGIFKARLWHPKTDSSLRLRREVRRWCRPGKRWWEFFKFPRCPPPAEGSCLMENLRDPIILSHKYQKYLFFHDSWIFNYKIPNSTSLPYCSGIAFGSFLSLTHLIHQSRGKHAENQLFHEKNSAVKTAHSQFSNTSLISPFTSYSC